MQSDDNKNKVSVPGKKPVLILHIGSPKTGTSALQVCMVKNQKFLVENKIVYSDFHPIHNGHANLTYGLFREFFKNAGMEAEAKGIATELSAQFPADIVNNLKRNFYDNNCHVIVISHEVLFEVISGSDRGASINEQKNYYVMTYFKEIFKDFDIKIVCYLRRQDDYIESMYNQYCKMMDNKRYNNIVNNPPIIKFGEAHLSNIFLASLLNGWINMSYYKTLSQWAEIYGKENIIVRPYEKSQLPHGIEYDFFENILGFTNDLFSRLDLDKDVNVSAKKDIIEYKIAAKLFNELSRQGLVNEQSRLTFDSLNNSSALDYLNENNKKNIVTAKLAEDILEYYKEENEKIAREYLNREDGILFYDKKREEKDDYPGLSLQATLDISRELVLMLKDKEQNLQTELSTVRNHNNSLQTELNNVKTKNDSLQTELNNVKTKNDSLQTELSTVRNHNNSLQTELNNVKTKNDSLQTELSTVRNHNNSLKTELTAAQNHNNSLQTELSTVRNHNNSLQTELEKANYSNFSLQAYINNLHESTSWKITKPFRFVKRLLTRKK